MLRSLLLAAAAVLAAAAPATANVDSHKVRQSPASVRDYWTAERMRTAIPMERARAGEPKAPRAKPGSTSSWSTVKVSWPATSSALNAHGKVFFSDGPYNYVCSGTLVSSSSGSVVWTAGHCVNEGPGDYFTNWAFVPAYNRNGVREPYGRWAATSLHTTTAWRTTTNAYGRDLGAAKLQLKSNTSLQGTISTARTLGTYTLATSAPVDSYGYPAAGKYSGQDMYLCDSYVSRRDSSTSPPTYGIPCGMTGGSSGGGWLDSSGRLVSVNSYGYQSLKNTMFGPVQDSVAASLLSAANSG